VFPLPLKSYLLMALYSVGGIFLLISLLLWVFTTFAKSGLVEKIFKLGVLLAYVGVVLFLCSTMLPCFNLVNPAFCRAATDQPWIALTFDDGPNDPFTSQVLDILEQNHVNATFFVLGKNVLRYPDVVKRMMREGFVVGNHTFDHQPLLFKSKAEVEKEIEDWEQVMKPLGLPNLKLLRAPHGWKPINLGSVLKEKGYRLIGWTRGVWDTDQPGAEVLYQRLTKNISNGEIILLHDGIDTQVAVDRSQLVTVLPQIIKYYKEKGYRFVTIPEMLERENPS